MEELIKYILQFGSLNQQQIAFIKSKATKSEFHKDEYFAKAGKVTRQVGFIVEGVMRVYHYNKGEKITRYFFDENQLILDWKNLETNMAASVYLQAVTDCKLMVFSKQDWEEISTSIDGWDTIIQKIIAQTHAEKLEKRSPLVAQDATTRYLEFIEKFPQIANRIPLSYLASYLGITQSSLSRIRRNIS